MTAAEKTEPKPRHVRVQWISTRGLKAHDATHELGDCCVLSGENGEGKSTVINALCLLANGFVPGVHQTPDGIMTLARDNVVSIEAGIVMPDGREAHVTRSWTRDRKGKIRQDIANDFIHGGLDEQKRWLAETLGGMPEAWNPESFWALSPSLMRAKLLKLLPKEEVSLERIIPAGCPSWAMPKFADPEPDVWARNAIERARGQIADSQKSIRELNVTLDELTGCAAEKSTVPLEQKLAVLREEKVAAGQYEVTGPQLERLREERATLAKHAAADAAPLPVAYLVHAVVHAAIASLKKEAARIDQAFDSLQTQRAAIAARIAREFQGVAVDTTVNEAELVSERLALDTDANRLSGTISQLEKQLAGWKASTLHECPNCKFDLRASREGERAALMEEIDSSKTELSMIRKALAEIDATLTGAKKAIELDKLRAQDKAHSEAMIRLLDEMDTLPPRTDDGWPELEHAEVEVDTGRDRSLDVADAKKRLIAVDAEIERLAALDTANAGATPRTADQIVADINAATVALKDLVAANEKAKRYKEAVIHLRETETQLDEEKAWLETFIQIEQGMIATAKTWIESRLDALLGGPKATVELYDARGNETCKFALDGVYVQTLSPGKQLIFKAGIVIVLASASDAPWKPLIIDEFERVSLRYRKAFIRAVHSAVTEGTLSQVLLAGCADQIPEVEGVKHIRLDHSKTKTEVAA